MHFKLAILDYLSVVWRYLNTIFRSFEINKSLASLPTFGKSYASTFQVAMALADHKSLPTCTRTLQFYRGAHLLGQDGILVTNFLFHPICLLTKASAVKNLLTSKENVERSLTYYFAKPILRNGLGTSGKKIWKDRRKLLAPTLHSKIIETYLSVFVQHSTVLRDKLTKLTGHELDVLPLLGYCALDIIAETAMGVQLNIQNNEDSEYLKCVRILCTSIVTRTQNVLHWAEWSYKLSSAGRRFYKSLDYIRDFSMKIIKQRIAERIESRKRDDSQPEENMKNKKRGLSFLDMVLDSYDDNTLGLEDVQDEVETILFAGHDTIALNMGWVLFLLGQNKECQRKVHEELDEIFGSDADAIMELDHFRRLPYLDCVIKEAGRLYSPGVLFGRRLDEDLIIDDKVIPKGTDCLVINDTIHRDPDVYVDPEWFIPERWLPSDEKEPPNPYAFLSFSAGPRGCLGFRYALLEMKVVLATILRSFTVESTLPRDKIIMVMEALQVPSGGLPVSFTPRLKIK